MAKPKYIVGIDLGTTNTVLTYTALSDIGNDNEVQINTFPILQELAKGSQEEQEILPSFIFERLKEKPVLPWDSADSKYIIGSYARERGADVPDRLVSSAKSWLCNSRIDRTKAVLPWNAPEANNKISPLDAMALFLAHLKEAWNNKNSKDKLENQKVIITIPASFDAAARDLVVEASKIAGLPSLTLLEEPQAAFYSWISQSDVSWRKQVEKNDIVLVIDVGGGTSDFSLIEISEENGDLALERVAVGNHILLGGDNMDLTLAYHARAKLEKAKKKVSQWQTVQLSHQCRKAKEILLNDPDKDSVPVVVSGRGSSVIAGALKTTIERKDIEEILIDGFFPKCDINAVPNDGSGMGFKELSLSYATDAAITKHLAKFLKSQNTDEKEYGFPNAILFNGGVFKSKIFRDRLLEVVNLWLKTAKKDLAKELSGFDLTQAVARGASYFGIAREGEGIRIRGGVSQSYYLGIETSQPAVPGYTPPIKAICVAKQGTEEGTTLRVENQTFGLVVGKKVDFKFFKSNCRRDDEFGIIIDEINDEFEETSNLTIELEAYDEVPSGSLVDVVLQVTVSEIGTLEIYCLEKSGEHKWKLEFNVRDAIK